MWRRWQPRLRSVRQRWPEALRRKGWCLLVFSLDPQDGPWSGVHEPRVPIGPPDEVGRLAVRTPDLEDLSVPSGLIGVTGSEDDAVSLMYLHRPSPCLWPIAHAKPDRL